MKLFSGVSFLFFLFQLFSKHIYDFPAFVIAAKLTNSVRRGFAAAMWTFCQFFGLQGKVASAPFLLAFRHVVSWYCHSCLWLTCYESFKNSSAVISMFLIIFIKSPLSMDLKLGTVILFLRGQSNRIWLPFCQITLYPIFLTFLHNNGKLNILKLL